MTNLEGRSDNLYIKLGLKTKKTLLNENPEKYSELVRILNSFKREYLSGVMYEVQEKFEIEGKITEFISENFPQLGEYRLTIKKKDSPRVDYMIYLKVNKKGNTNSRKKNAIYNV